MTDSLEISLLSSGNLKRVKLSGYPESSTYTVTDIVEIGLEATVEAENEELAADDKRIACQSCHVSMKDLYGCRDLYEGHLSKSPGCPAVLDFMERIIRSRVRVARVLNGQYDELELGDVAQRIESFRSYPHRAKVNVARVIESGFYWIGKGDRVECFRCSTRQDIANLFTEENPDNTHIKLSPDCHFMLEKLGPNYVQNILNATDAEEIDDDVEPEQPYTQEQDVPAALSDITQRVGCSVCLERVSNVMFVPCTHIATCLSCYMNLLRPRCPICRIVILDYQMISI